jgi:hypothetical protein
MENGHSILRIGVTGHRPNRLPPEGQRLLRDKLAPLFAEMAGQASASCSDDLAARKVVTIVSALAEGVDRMVASAGLAAGFSLHVVLPFAAEEYEGDFETAESRKEFRGLLTEAAQVTNLDGSRSAPEEAYHQAGIAVLDASDVIVAVWDGKPAHGKGGTAEIVQEALRRSTPVLSFAVDGDGPFLLGDPTVVEAGPALLQKLTKMARRHVPIRSGSYRLTSDGAKT